MEYVNERIHRIPQPDLSILEHRLSVTANTGVHSSYRTCMMHCLYFERVYESISFEDRNGLFRNNEYRISYMDRDLSTLRLDKKSAVEGMSKTESCEISLELAETILQGHFSNIVKDVQGRTGDDLPKLLQEFYWEVIGRGLRPKIVIDYFTKPYRYSQGNTEVIINFNPRICTDVQAFLNPFHKTMEASNNQAVVHVKWDHALPEVVRTAFLMTGIPGNSIYHSYRSII